MPASAVVAKGLFICFAGLALAQTPQAQDPAVLPPMVSEPPGAGGPAPFTASSEILPSPAAAAILPKPGARGPGVEWKPLSNSSLRFLSVMHAFRWATEPGTRKGGIGLGPGYRRSVASLHGWSDGDPLYVNYVGHPMQGAVAGRLFLIHDPRYNQAEFGRSSEYWKGKLRATAFAWAFSAQFEVGLVSEASIGQIQAIPPQQGFVDHVVTPAFGLGWMVAEDALDAYLVKRIEHWTGNPYVRMLARGGLNPARSFANVLSGKLPWYRESRAGILAYTAGESRDRAVLPAPAPAVQPVAPFEFSVAPGWRQFAGRACAGGGAEAAYRPRTELQLVMAVNGCRLLRMEQERSGDVLVFQVGPRWTPAAEGRWSPYTHLLVGGMKITTEQTSLRKPPVVEDKAGVALSAGAGVDYRLNNALALRVASVEYLKSSVGSAGGAAYGSGLQVSTGVVLRIGTW